MLTGSAPALKYEGRRPAVLAHARSEEHMEADRDAMKMGRGETSGEQEEDQSWFENLKGAFLVNGGDTEHPPTMAAWAGHVVSLPWKVLAALLPPASLMGGYPLFVCAIGFIGIITFFVDEIASLLGCYLGVPDAITAITFVALGTSLPDTFASRTAALNDDYADDSVPDTFASRTAALNDDYADDSVGNITGSNSVNVRPPEALSHA